MLNFGSWAACPRSVAERGRLHAVLGGFSWETCFTWRTCSQKCSRIFYRSDDSIADELNPGRFIQKFKNEFGVIECELAQGEAIGFKNIHRQ
jgi:hypothetical protein